MGTEEVVEQLIFSNALTRKFVNGTLRGSLLMPTDLRLAEEIVNKCALTKLSKDALLSVRNSGNSVSFGFEF
jgi:hypothetical protein